MGGGSVLIKNRGGGVVRGGVFGAEMPTKFSFADLTNFTRDPLKKSFPPGDFEGATSLKSYELSGNHFRNNFASEDMSLSASQGAKNKPISKSAKARCFIVFLF